MPAQGCSTLSNSLLGQYPVEAGGVVVKGSLDVGLAVVAQQIESEVAGRDCGG